jgi:Flp pilus assembly protein TadG
MATTLFSSILKTFAANRRGNLGMVAAITIPILAAGAGVAIDYTRLVNEQRVLQDALDAAAVSAAASMVAGHHDSSTVKDYAANLVDAAIGDSLTTAEKTELRSNLTITVTSTTGTGTKTYDIKLASRFNVGLSPFSQFLGFSSRPVAAVSATESQYAAKNAMSMYVVLDRSGSMSFVTDTVNSAKTKCQNYTASNWSQYPNLSSTKPCYINKMGALKTAAATLFDALDTLEAKDTTDTIIRIGGVSFTDTMQTPDAIAWGTTNIRSYVNSLPAYPTGGTDMTDGMDQAYQSLKATSETTAHTAKGNKTFSKFIVLMTDGENTGASSTWDPALDTETLNTCTSARNAGITIYTVAFMAPSNGETLLKSCAGVSSNFYSANDMASLVAAFADIGSKAAEKATRITN